MRFVILVSSLSVAALGCGRDSTTGPTPGRIVGTVTLAGLDPQPPVTVALVGPVDATTTTSASGAYAFAGLPAGRYTVSVAEAYSLEGSASTPVDVTRGDATAGPLRLTPGGSVSGTITLAGLDPQPPLTVTLSGAVVVSTVADPSGAYAFGLVPLGDYVVSVADPRTVEGSADATVRVGMGPSPSPALRLTPLGSVAGVVSLPGLDAQPCVTVTLSGPVDRSTVTDAAGAYAFAHLPVGDYSVSVADASTLEGSATVAVRVGLGASIAPVLGLTPLGTISGAVDLLGLPARAGLAVSFTGPVSGAGATDVSGRFRFGPLPVGTYVVTASEPYSVEGSASTTVHVGLGPAAAPGLSLTPTGRLSGRVVLSHTPPRAGLAVTLRERGTTYLRGRTSTDADGAYSFGPLPLGSFTVSAAAPSTAEATVSAPVDVGFGANAAPDLVFTALGGVAGSVTVAGAAAANAVVWPQGSRRAATTDAAGTFQLAGMPAGPNALVASRAGLDTSTAVVDVSYAATVTAAFALHASAAGQPGTARLAGAASVLGVGRTAGVTVAVDGTGLSAVSAADGTWAIESVPDGLWSLTLTDGVRLEHVPAAFAISGTDGFLLDGDLYPIGEIELQNALHVTSRTAVLRQLTSDGHLVVLDGTDLLSVPLAGGPPSRIAADVQWFRLPSTATAAHGWIAVYGTNGAVSAVRASGGPAIPIANLSALEFDPTGDVLMGLDGDDRLWYAALERGDVRPVAHGWGSVLSLAPGYFRFADSTTGEAGTVEYATGKVAMWGARSICGVRAAAGGRLVVKEDGAGPCYGRVLVGAPGGALTEVAPASDTLFNLAHSVSPDGRFVAVDAFDLVTPRADVVVAATDGSAVRSEPNAAFLQWSPDSTHFTWRHYTGTGDLELATSTGATSMRVSPPSVRDELFSPDGRFLAFSDGTATKVVATLDGTVVASVAASYSPPLAFSPDSRFLVLTGTSLRSVSLPDGAVTVVSSLTPYTGVDVSPDGKHLLFRSEEGLSTAPPSGAPRVLLVPAGTPGGGGGFLAPTDAVLFTSSDGLHVVPIEGGAFVDLGAPPPHGGFPSVAADGLSVALLDGGGILRSAALPAGPAEVVASGVEGYQRTDAGLVIRHAGGALSVAGPTGAATPVGTGVASWTIAPGGRVLFSDDADRLFSAALPSGATSLLATDVTAFDVRADRVAGWSGGVLRSTATSGGPLAAHLRMEPTPWFLGSWSWLDDRHGVAVRTGATPPRRFQNGLYLVTVP